MGFRDKDRLTEPTIQTYPFQMATECFLGGISMSMIYIIDEELKMLTNSNKQNYWDLYLEEVCTLLGNNGRAVDIHNINESILSTSDVVFIGNINIKDPSIKETLRKWAEEGGCLVGFMTIGLEDVFDIKSHTVKKQPNLFEPCTYIDIESNVPGDGNGSRKISIPVYSDILLTRFNNEHKHIASFIHEGASYGATTEINAGKGKAVYFSFSLPQSIWIINQGKPVPDEGEEYLNTGVYYCKTITKCILSSKDFSIPVCDELIYTLWNIISTFTPSVDPIMPKEGEICDALFYWGGDDEFIRGKQKKSSEWMKSKGLPYHINLICRNGEFAVDQKDIDVIKSNGHEISLHPDFISDNKPPFLPNKKELHRQIDYFIERFGYPPNTSVFHYTVWRGGSETAEWMAEKGMKGDNSFITPYCDKNGVLYGFGTGYPFFFYKGPEQGNERLDFIEQPITGFEMGYANLAKKPEDDVIDEEALRHSIDITVKNRGFLNCFYHTYRICDWKGAVNAINCILSYIEKKEYKILHVGNDRLTDWWFKRKDIFIRKKASGYYTIENVPDEGAVIRLSIDEKTNMAPKILVNGNEINCRARQIYGRKCMLFVLAKGNHILEVIN
jgi:hypothetical protein